MVKGINSIVIYLIYCKNLCKCHNIPPPSTTIKRMKVIKMNEAEILELKIMMDEMKNAA
jgi:hypothetical protein